MRQVISAWIRTGSGTVDRIAWETCYNLQFNGFVSCQCGDRYVGGSVRVWGGAKRTEVNMATERMYV